MKMDSYNEALKKVRYQKNQYDCVKCPVKELGIKHYCKGCNGSLRSEGQ